MKKLLTLFLLFAAPLYAAPVSIHVDGPGVVSFTPDAVTPPAPTPVPTVVPPAPTPVPVPPQVGNLPPDATLTPNFMKLGADGLYASTNFGNSNATNDQKAWLEILLAKPFQHNATLDFWAMTNIDPETAPWNVKFPVRAYGHSLTPSANEYIGHTVNAGAMQFTEERPTKTYGYFDILKTPGTLIHYVAYWDFDANFFTFTVNGQQRLWQNVDFGAVDRVDFNIQLVIANTTDGNPGAPKGSYFKVRSDVKLTGN